MMNESDWIELPKPKPAHTGIPKCVAPIPEKAQMVYLVVREDGKMYDYFESRHGAVGLVSKLSGYVNKKEWLDILYVPKSTIRKEDLVRR